MTKAEFSRVYREGLSEAVRTHPDEYPAYTPEQVEQVTDRMMRALDAGTANITGSIAFRLLARRLGIKHTVKDIRAAREACTA